MICRFCGSTLDNNERECPYCGHKVAPDVLDTFNSNRNVEPEEEYDEPEDSESESYESDYEEKPVKKVKRSIPVPTSVPKKADPTVTLIGVAACALLSLICLLVTLGVSRKVSDMYDGIKSALYNVQDSVTGVSNKIDNIDSSVGKIDSNISQQSSSQYITITKQPSSVDTYLGRGSESDDVQNPTVFSVEATGNNLTFDWQRYDEVTSTWVSIVFDAKNNDNNVTYGLHLYTSPTSSLIAAHDITSAAFGSYRCVISDAYGSKTTETVILSERAQ